MPAKSNIGGQAVMEGIMMRHKGEYSVAVRKPDGEIALKKEEYKNVIPIKGIENIPILRGISSFIDSLVIGTKTIMYSASFYEDEEDTKEKSQKDKEKEEKRYMAFSVSVAVLFSVGLFILLPYFLSRLLRSIGASETVCALAEAVIRIIVFLAYMIAISQIKDIQRVFMYHGAEHKCINCIENGHELTVENVMKSSRQHKRCGTSFMLFVVLISGVFFLILGALGINNPLLRIGIRILLVPVIAGVAYEIIRLAANSEKGIICMIAKPGLAMQKLVTREPDESQVEVAIAAVEEVFDWREFLKENFSGEDE